MIVDIETGPLPWEEIKHLAPEEALAAPAPVEITDEMIQAKQAELGKKYSKDSTVASHLQKWIDGIKEENEKLRAGGSNPAREKWLKDQLLDPTRSCVDAIGIKTEARDRIIIVGESNEQEELGLLIHEINRARVVVGHGIKRFDLPYIMKRALILGLPFPANWMKPGFRYFEDKFVDTMEVWSCGLKWNESFPGDVASNRASMDYLSKVFGLPCKPGKGIDFHRYDGSQKQSYLRHDLDRIKDFAETFGIEWKEGQLAIPPGSTVEPVWQVGSSADDEDLDSIPL